MTSTVGIAASMNERMMQQLASRNAEISLSRRLRGSQGVRVSTGFENQSLFAASDSDTPVSDLMRRCRCTGRQDERESDEIDENVL